MPKTMTDTLEELESQLAQLEQKAAKTAGPLEAKAAELRKAIAARQAEEAERREAREEAWEVEFLARHGALAEELRADEQKALRAATAALLEAPWAKALVEARGARWARVALSTFAGNLARSHDRPPPHDLDPREFDFLAYLAAQLEQAAQVAGYAVLERLEAERDAAAEGS